MVNAESAADSARHPWVVEAGGGVRLLASLDHETGRCFFPPVPETSPQARQFKPIALATEAVVYSHTTIFPAARTGKAPFALVYADFPEGVRVLGRFRSASERQPEIGQRVRVELETAADGGIDYVFTPAE